MFYTSINASKEQVEKFYKKHCKPFFGISKIVKKSYSCDDEDGIGFVTLETSSGKKISYQIRGFDTPMFVSIIGFGNIKYDVHYPHQIHEDFYNFLKKYAQKTKDEFERW